MNQSNVEALPCSSPQMIRESGDVVKGLSIKKKAQSVVFPTEGPWGKVIEVQFLSFLRHSEEWCDPRANSVARPKIRFKINPRFVVPLSALCVYIIKSLSILI